jgi:hypothetical protein
MKKFITYVKLKEADQLGGNSCSLDHTETKELLGVLWDRYQPELKEFIVNLADQNDDQDLRELVKKMNNSGKDMAIIKKDAQEVVPFTADRGGEGGLEKDD